MTNKTKTIALLLVYGCMAPLLADNFSISESRPLMALCRELQDKYGMLITYEDAPSDPISEIAVEPYPNGSSLKYPKSLPVTFHIQTGLPTRSDPSLDLSSPANPVESLAAVQDLVDQYNKSGNPGRFSVHTDGTYIRIQQTARNVNGQSQPFEPISSSVLPWKSESASCQNVIQDLVAALRQARAVAVVEGMAPIGSLLTKSCKTAAGPQSAAQILGSVMDGLNANPYPGMTAGIYTWHLVYDPTWNKYFLNIYLASTVKPETNTAASTNQPAAKKLTNQGSGRLGTFSSPAPH